jgi:phosphoglycerate dehydrogenase-like enzyme
MEKALIQALQGKKIGGAVLDVFEEEPLPAESPLWHLPNVFITPHISGYSFPSDIVTIFAENYRRFLAGNPMLYPVEFKRGY